jgi:hypothetical protein
MDAATKATGLLIAHWACKAVESEKGFEWRSGYCLRFVRQVVQAALGADAWSITQGLNARNAAAAFDAKGWMLPIIGNSIPGDLFFWTADRHGIHGHCGIRVVGNRLAENSFFHATSPMDDARGYRLLSELPKNYRIVRFPARFALPPRL